MVDHRSRVYELNRNVLRVDVKESTVRVLCSRQPGSAFQAFGRVLICPVSVNLPSAFKNISVPGLVP